MPMTRPATRRGFCLPQRRMPSPLASIEAERAYAPPFAGDVIVKQVLSQSASRAAQRRHCGDKASAAALPDQRRERHGEDALAGQAVAADAVTVRLELAESVEDDLVGGGEGMR